MAPYLCVVCLEPGDLKRCMCRAGGYCSKACQWWHWEYAEDPHKDVCPMTTANGIFDHQAVPSDARKIIFSFLGKTKESRKLAK
jgi:hypothetical protein